MSGVDGPRRRPDHSRSLGPDRAAPARNALTPAPIAQSGQSVRLVSGGSPVRIRLGAHCDCGTTGAGPDAGSARAAGFSPHIAFVAQWQSAPLVWARSRVQSSVKAPRLSVTIRCASGAWNRQTQHPARAGSYGGKVVLGKPAAAGRKSRALRGCGAVGSAAPCQGAGRGFEPRHPLGMRRRTNARFAEFWQTRRSQEPVSVRTWGFESPDGHRPSKGDLVGKSVNHTPTKDRHFGSSLSPPTHIGL
jgi:hypothetical protein